MNRDFKVVSIDFRDMMRPPEKGLAGELSRFNLYAETRIKILPHPQRESVANRAGELYLQFLGIAPGELNETFEVTRLENLTAKARSYAQVLGLDTTALQIAAIDEGLDHTIFDHAPNSGASGPTPS